MKTEQIAEKAKELAHIYSREVQLGFQNPGSYQGYCHGYIKGYEDGIAEVNAEWQEKVRWKNINEEKPKNGKLYIVKSNYSSHPIIARYTGPLMPKWILFSNSEVRMEINGVTNYREIIE